MITPPPILQVVGSTYQADGAASVKLGFTLTRSSESVVKRVTWTLPKAATVSTRGFASCSVAQAERGKCRARAFVGSGRLTVATGDTGTRSYEMTLYADGRRHLVLAFTGDDGIVAGRADLTRRQVRFDLPKVLRRPTGFTLELGPAQSFTTLRRCQKPQVYGVRLALAAHPAVTARATSACRR